jgi:hypothetical protein
LAALGAFAVWLAVALLQAYTNEWAPIRIVPTDAAIANFFISPLLVD